MFDFAYEKVTVEEAKKVLDGPPENPARPAWTVKRSPPAAEKLFAFTAKWILELPVPVRPMQLAKLYARIANDLCRNWPQPARWDRYMADLLIVGREGRARQGFPPEVASELVALNEYHAKLYPPPPEKIVATVAWQSAAVRRRA